MMLGNITEVYDVGKYHVRTHNDVGESDAYLGEYLGNIVKVDVMKVDGVDTSGGLETPAAIKRVQRTTAV